ncbi:MAG TPA: sulfite exporter TauE/SafE family protein [Glaciihabitans sp.]|nr:sulfite exporter TauE/SafE family protein [Glaciihabitans sp.]
MSTVTHTPRYWIALALIGIIGGVLSGMFGIGGGIIMVPLLISFAGMNQKQASATSLVAIIPTAVVGSLTYFANGQIDFLAGGIIAVGAIVGALIGSYLLKRIPLVWLRWMFIVLILVVAARMLFIEPERGDQLEMSGLLALGYVALGLVMGIASGLFGIGGGIIAVPSLVAIFGMSDLIAKGTSLLVMIPTGITGTISNVRARLVNVGAGLVVGIAATLAAVPGVALALLLPPRVSAILFAALLLVAAIQLTIKAIKAQRADRAAR